jgi:hypothetical protein
LPAPDITPALPEAPEEVPPSPGFSPAPPPSLHANGNQATTIPATRERVCIETHV